MLYNLIQQAQIINEKINNAKNIIITSHENPDGDSIGSSLALHQYLLSLGKNVRILFHNDIPSVYNIFKEIDSITISDNYNKDIFDSIDLLFILDVNSKTRISSIGKLVADIKCTKIMIDHHHNPEDIADIYMVNPLASATGELIYQLINSNTNFKIDYHIALAIYVAIMTDTGSFKFQNTTPESHYIAAELIKIGVKPAEVYDDIYNNLEYKVRKVLGQTFSSAKLYLDGRLNISIVKASLLEKNDLSIEDLNGFSETTLGIVGVLVGILISEVPNTNIIKVSFRSKLNIDVRSIAVKYGGGGHLNAAGTKFEGYSISKIKSMLLKDIQVLLENYFR